MINSGKPIQHAAKIVPALILLMIFGCAVSTPSVIPTARIGAATSIYVINHGWHTGIAVKRRDIPAGIWPESVDFPDARYLEVGWGDGDYYPAPDAGIGTALQAAFLSRRIVLHVVGLNDRVVAEFPFSEIVELPTSQDGVARLCEYIDDSFDRNGGRRAISLGSGIYGNSRFYPARGRFHLFNNCNTWTARGLQAAGYPINPHAITADDVMRQARESASTPPADSDR